LGADRVAAIFTQSNVIPQARRSLNFVMTGTDS
jgi:hypothetical protein